MEEAAVNSLEKSIPCSSMYTIYVEVLSMSMFLEIYGLWVMGYGLWVMGYGLWGQSIECKSPKRFSSVE